MQETTGLKAERGVCVGSWYTGNELEKCSKAFNSDQ